jgi:hypothetical protein
MAVLFRALVMLACLVAIPLAAVFGTSLRDVFTAVFGNRWASDTVSANAALAEAPRFDRSPPAQPPNPVPADANAAPLSALPPATNPLGGAAPGVVPAGFEASPASPATYPPSHAGAPRVAPGPLPPLSPVVQGVGSQGPPAAPPAAGDRFGDVEARLRQLGATRYWLEEWGRGQSFYRFRCEVALDGNPDYVRYFEATGADRLQAMAEVLHNIEVWRSGGR